MQEPSFQPRTSLPNYDSSILSTSARASSQVSLFFLAHSIWLFAYASWVGM
jgi:hypothetical protein